MFIRCGRTTPFGSPVEPEVNRTYAAVDSSAISGTGSVGTDSSASRSSSSTCGESSGGNGACRDRTTATGRAIAQICATRVAGVAGSR
ncbi:hypothetical protein GCM10018954_099150 [Kutzneria kofuensis]